MLARSTNESFEATIGIRYNQVSNINSLLEFCVKRSCKWLWRGQIMRVPPLLKGGKADVRLGQQAGDKRCCFQTRYCLGEDRISPIGSVCPVLQTLVGQVGHAAQQGRPVVMRAKQSADQLPIVPASQTSSTRSIDHLIEHRCQDAVLHHVRTGVGRHHGIPEGGHCDICECRPTENTTGHANKSADSDESYQEEERDQRQKLAALHAAATGYFTTAASNLEAAAQTATDQ
mmetsp:Transcript_22552/g.43237  ORF Transcript_22552/g.43237 Transcript_22552/m.43237 type:complete len:231 (-) Transcript_22552:840-1532(-)